MSETDEKTLNFHEMGLDDRILKVIKLKNYQILLFYILIKFLSLSVQLLAWHLRKKKGGGVNKI